MQEISIIGLEYQSLKIFVSVYINVIGDHRKAYWGFNFILINKVWLPDVVLKKLSKNKGTSGQK